MLNLSRIKINEKEFEVNISYAHDTLELSDAQQEELRIITEMCGTPTAKVAEVYSSLRPEFNPKNISERGCDGASLKSFLLSKIQEVQNQLNQYNPPHIEKDESPLKVRLPNIVAGAFPGVRISQQRSGEDSFCLKDLPIESAALASILPKLSNDFISQVIAKTIKIIQNKMHTDRDCSYGLSGSVLSGVVEFCLEDKLHKFAFNLGDGDIFSFAENSSKEMQVVRLNRRHNLSNSNECQTIDRRLNADNGTLLSDYTSPDCYGHQRVNGSLLLTRSIGDSTATQGLPESFHYQIPEICYHVTTFNPRHWTVLCSDGAGTDGQLSAKLLEILAPHCSSCEEFSQLLLVYTGLYNVIPLSSGYSDDKTVMVIEPPPPFTTLNERLILRLACVCDGHGNEKIAKFLRGMFANFFAQVLSHELKKEAQPTADAARIAAPR